MSETFVDSSALISENAILGHGCKVWGLAQVREGARLGSSCIVGRGAYIGAGVTLGDNCKVQNAALVYEPAVIESGVFIGPGAILTNDEFPRAVTVIGNLKSPDEWVPVGVTVRQGASIGAGAICIAPVTIGEWALVGAGSTVTRDVSPYSIVVGSPARHVGWVGRAGKPLKKSAGVYRCPETGELYREVEGKLLLVATP
jgi:UDP-2-acetamido-3-amino-2,3-dideoxy-glucuronate N-acetyltransferase